MLVDSFEKKSRGERKIRPYLFVVLVRFCFAKPLFLVRSLLRKSRNNFLTSAKLKLSLGFALGSSLFYLLEVHILNFLVVAVVGVTALGTAGLLVETAVEVGAGLLLCTAILLVHLG